MNEFLTEMQGTARDLSNLLGQLLLFVTSETAWARPDLPGLSDQSKLENSRSGPSVLEGMLVRKPPGRSAPPTDIGTKS